MSGTGSWRDMFEEPGSRAVGPAAAPPAYEPDDAELAPDLSVYHPWTLQRGRSRPAMMLELRRYEPRSGLWSGWQLSYSHLIAVEYTGDQFVSLDFSTRNFIIQGQGLQELIRHLQQGTVQAISEYSAAVWPARPQGPAVFAIRHMDGRDRSLDA